MAFRNGAATGIKPDNRGAFGVEPIPLTILAHIISYLEGDVGTLSRLCRVSRVLNYMALPLLWKHVTLTSYSTIRYRDDLPEGFGSASPFSMGLNALVTRNLNTLVRTLALEGDFGAADLHEHSKVGRISESNMIMNIAVRAAVDRCNQLEKFTWDMTTRIQPNVYAGLVQLERLEKLWLRFPNCRSPQPATEIPGMPNLKSLTITHYDPLCYPDDLSNLIYTASGLEELVMHFNPRMRDQGESSVVLSHFFRKNIAGKRVLNLKKVGMYNLFANADASECVPYLNPHSIKEFTAINTFGFDEGRVPQSGVTHFIDRTWLVPPSKEFPQPKSFRIDQLHKRHALDLTKCQGLERLYLVNARYKPEGTNGQYSPNSSDASPMVAPGGCSSRSSRGSGLSLALRDLYLDGICNVCGPTLTHLILPSRWQLPTAITARIIRSCPNLSQLSASIECHDMEVLRLLVPFLSRLYAIRILRPSMEGEEGDQKRAIYDAFTALDDEVHEAALREAFSGKASDGGLADFAKLRYVAFGQRVWEIGGNIEELVQFSVDADDETVDEEERLKGYREIKMYKRKLKRVSEKEVADIEIWKMDTLDVV